MLNSAPPPLVSVVTPVFNGERYIQDLLASVVGQREIDVEHVVVDDGSTDDTPSILEQWRREHRRVLRVLRHENRGQYASMNDGLKIARGRLVLFICADDRLASSSSLAAAWADWCRARGPDVLQGRWRIINAEGRVVAPPRFTLWLPRLLAKYINFHSHCAMLVSREAILREGLAFDALLRYAGDWDFVISILERRLRRSFTRTVIADYRAHPQQTTHVAAGAVRQVEIASVLRRHGVNRSLLKLGNQGRMAAQWLFGAFSRADRL